MPTYVARIDEGNYSIQLCDQCKKQRVTDTNAEHLWWQLGRAGAASEQLRKFLDVAAGEGYVFDGVDAADLYVSIFGDPSRLPEQPPSSPTAKRQGKTG
jgi:hypothetical protein